MGFENYVRLVSIGFQKTLIRLSALLPKLAARRIAPAIALALVVGGCSDRAAYRSQGILPVLINDTALVVPTAYFVGPIQMDERDREGSFYRVSHLMLYGTSPDFGVDPARLDAAMNQPGFTGIMRVWLRTTGQSVTADQAVERLRQHVLAGQVLSEGRIGQERHIVLKRELSSTNPIRDVFIHDDGTVTTCNRFYEIVRVPSCELTAVYGDNILQINFDRSLIEQRLELQETVTSTMDGWRR